MTAWKRLTHRCEDRQATLTSNASVADLVERLAWYEDMVDQRRFVVLPDEAEEQRFLVETALQIKLLPWQVAYIWGGVHRFPAGRCTGKTLAHVIRLCLSEGEALYMYPLGKHCQLCDEYHGPWYADIYRKYVQDVYFKLEAQGGLKLRKIYFNNPHVNNKR